jgi:hypothetical protein
MRHAKRPRPKIIVLFLLFLTTFAHAQYHLGYGELVSSSQGCDLYFQKPQQDGSAVGTYSFVNTTGRNMRVDFTRGGTEQIIYIQGHNNAKGSDQSDVVRTIYAPRGTIQLTDVVFGR